MRIGPESGGREGLGALGRDGRPWRLDNGGERLGSYPILKPLTLAGESSETTSGAVSYVSAQFGVTPADALAASPPCPGDAALETRAHGCSPCCT